MQNINELKQLRAQIDSVIETAEQEAQSREKVTLSNYKTKLNLLESVSSIIEKCGYSDSGVVEFAQQYYDALTDPDGPREERIYETFIEGLSPFGYLNPVQAELKALKNRVRKDKENIDMVEILDIMKDSQSYYIVEHIEESVLAYLDSKNSSTRVQLISSLSPYMYDPFVKQIYAMVVNDMSKDQYLTESYKVDKTLESLERVGDLIAHNVVTPVVALDSTRTAIKLGHKWVQLKGRTFSNLMTITDVTREEYELGRLLDNDSRIYIDTNRNEIWYALSGEDINTTSSPVIIKDKDNILFENQAYTCSEFSLINEARIDFIQLVDINNICLLANHFDDIAYLENTVEYNNPNDPTRALKVFITVFNDGDSVSDDEYSIIVSNAADSTYDIYNNVSELDVVNLLNDVLGLSIVALSESSKDNVEVKKKEFKTKCTQYESKINSLKSKRAKIEGLIAEFDSEELATSLTEIESDIEDLEKEYRDYQDDFGFAAPDNKTTIKGISFQNKVDQTDVDTPLTDDSTDFTGDIDSLDTVPGDDEMQYEMVPDEFDDIDDASSAYDPDSFYSKVEDEGSEESDDVSDVRVYFNKSLGEETSSYLSGKVAVAYSVVDTSGLSDTPVGSTELVNFDFTVDANTGDPNRDIRLTSNEGRSNIPGETYAKIIDQIKNSEEYQNFTNLDNKLSSYSNLDDVIADPELDSVLASNVRFEGPIKSFVLEGAQGGKKFIKKFINESYTDDVEEAMSEPSRLEMDDDFEFESLPVDDANLDSDPDFDADDNLISSKLAAMGEEMLTILEENDTEIGPDLSVDDPAGSNLFDVDYLPLTMNYEDEDGDIRQTKSYIMRINWSAAVDPVDAAVVNTEYLVVADQDSAVNFILNVAQGDYGFEDLNSMIVDTVGDIPENEYNVRLVQVDPDNVADVLIVNYASSLDIDLDDIDQVEALSESVKLILNKSKEKKLEKDLKTEDIEDSFKANNQDEDSVKKDDDEEDDEENGDSDSDSDSSDN